MSLAGALSVEIQMAPAEWAFLTSHIRPTDHVWEWGAGWSTVKLAELCARITSVEHNREWALRILPYLPPNASLLYVPPDGEWDDATETRDGDYGTFMDYVDAYNGGADVVIVDGRARLASVERVLGCDLPEGPRVILVHDMGRPELEEIREIAELHEVERVGTLARFEVRP